MKSNIRFITHADLAACAKARSPEYLQELAPAIVRRDDKGVWIERYHPAFIAMLAKYKPARIAERANNKTGIPPGTGSTIASSGENYRVKWEKLHKIAMAGLLDDAYLDRLFKSLPCGDCSTSATAYRKAHPLPDDKSLHFRWTADFHNSVNVKLGKPIVSVLDAEIIWRSAANNS